MQSSKKDLILIAVKLLVICSIVAAIVAFVNSITKDRIAYNNKLSTAEALTGIYSADYDGKSFEVKNDNFVITDSEKAVVTCTPSDMSPSSDEISALYVLKNENGENTGYCVAISPMGFKAPISMLVAVNADMTVKGVKIVSMSDTSGIGTKAQEPSFLEQFTGLTGEASGNVDAISGATKTSKPVINAVKNAVNEVEIYINTSGGEVK